MKYNTIFDINKTNIEISAKHQSISIDDIKRFYKYVNVRDDDECWEWNGSLDAYGYGVFSIKHKLIKSHRFSYAINYLDLSTDLVVCHKCDNPKCVNPNHLWQDTNNNNINDRVKKQRTRTGHYVGSNNNMSKLTEDDVIEIRKIYDPNSWSTRKLAKKYGVSQTNIRNILSYKSWKYVGTNIKKIVK